MTPKEKAKDLLDKYVGFKLNPYNDPEMSLTKFKAKKNALICIEKQKELLRRIGTKENQLEYDELFKVQGELIKL